MYPYIPIKKIPSWNETEKGKIKVVNSYLTNCPVARKNTFIGLGRKVLLGKPNAKSKKRIDCQLMGLIIV